VLVVGAGTLALGAGVTLCPFALLTGVPCPGCGLGRATLALLAGHFRDALHFHPLIGVVLSALALAAFRATRPQGARSGSWIIIGASTLLVLLLGVWVARFGGAFGGPVPVRTLWAAG
jgi:hypothetical protein